MTGEITDQKELAEALLEQAREREPAGALVTTGSPEKKPAGS